MQPYKCAIKYTQSKPISVFTCFGRCHIEFVCLLLLFSHGFDSVNEIAQSIRQTNEKCRRKHRIMNTSAAGSCKYIEFGMSDRFLHALCYQFRLVLLQVFKALCSHLCVCVCAILVEFSALKLHTLYHIQPFQPFFHWNELEFLQPFTRISLVNSIRSLTIDDKEMRNEWFFYIPAASFRTSRWYFFFRANKPFYSNITISHCQAHIHGRFHLDRIPF